MINSYSPYSYPARNNPVESQRKSLRWFLYLIILAAGGFGLSFYFSSLGEDYSLKILNKEGGFEYRESSGNEWREVEKFPLEPKISYEMRTLADGKARIESSDGSKITMGNFARLVLLKNQGEISWAQTDGTVRYLVEKNDKRKAYTIILSDGELVVLGTDFVVKVEEKDTTIYVYGGRVKAIYKDQSSQEAGENEKIILNPLEKKVVAFEEQDFSSPLRNDSNPGPEIKESLVPIESNNSEQTTETENVTPNVENKNENVNNSNKNESISVGEEKNQNVNQNKNSNGNTNSGASITSSAVKVEGSSDSQTTQTAPKPTTTTSSGTKKAGSGVTTRSKCEDSGGHWTGSGNICKCPPGENFTGGKCKRQ